VRENVMLGAISLLSVMAGAVTAYLAERFPARVETLETGAGALIIGGFALLGCALPAMV
jgi:hypothetical protein